MLFLICLSPLPVLWNVLHQMSADQSKMPVLICLSPLSAPCNTPFMTLPRAQDTGGENLCIGTKGVQSFRLWRLGHQVADHPWSALRMVKSCRKTAQRLRALLEAKAPALLRNGTRTHYLNSLQKRGGEGGEGKRSAGKWIGQPIRSTER